MKSSHTPTAKIETQWNKLFLFGGIAGLAMLGIMVAQIAIFIIWPPPETVSDFFALFQKNWLLGLLSMDLLYLINNAVLILIYLALFMALKPTHPPAMSIALALGLVGIAAYYASNTAFEMLRLSQFHAEAANETQKAIFLSAGEAMLATYKGTAFDVYYVLNGVMLLITAAVMFKSELFSKATASWGLAAAILMTIPSTAGKIGLIFSLASLVPWAVFLGLIVRRFFKLARQSG
ncbi:MAG TPA: DUF4386 family protein [Anaerolineaceae bacterium]|jgi:hypothetical protein|nr:DUF4386 family protein [Anaerolineaceae bacterium]